MKGMKRLLALAVTLVAALVVAVPAFADQSSAKGSLTITNAHENETYTLYRVLDLQGDAYPTGSSYLYKTADGWDAFITDPGTGGKFVTVDHDGFVTLKSGVSSEKNSAEVIAFATSAVSYAKDRNILGTKGAHGTDSDGKDTVTFADLSIGYYVLTTSAGTNPIAFNVDTSSVIIDEKNEAPEVDKQVQTGTDENNNPIWDESNSANIGDTVTFKTTITAKRGAKNYVLHDKMDPGLTFGSVSSIVWKGSELEEGDDYTVQNSGLDDGCTFHVSFSQGFCDELADNDVIVVNYTAVLNEHAVTVTEDEGSNDNETWLNYGDNSETTHDFTKTYTYKFQIVKTDGGNANGEYKVLDGAEFQLHRDSASGELVYFIMENDGYHVAKQGAPGAVDTITAGTPIIRGLEEGTYVLVETEAPKDYNKADYITITLNADNVAESSTIRTGTEGSSNTFVPTKDADGNITSGGIHVVNHSGSMLPSTGGMGTTILYIVGGVLVVGAVTALVIVRRRSARTQA